MARLAALRDVPLFRGLGRKTLLELNRRARETHYRTGETLITEGEPGETLFVIVRGRVTVHREGELVGELGASDYFGEMSLIDGAPRAATIIARDETVVLQIRADDFNALMRLPEVARDEAAAVAERMCEVMHGLGLRADEVEVAITASIGVASLMPEEDLDAIEKLPATPAVWPD